MKGQLPTRSVQHQLGTFFWLYIHQGSSASLGGGGILQPMFCACNVFDGSISTLGVSELQVEETPEECSQYLHDAHPLAADLICQMMVYKPSERMTAAQALQHPFCNV